MEVVEIEMDNYIFLLVAQIFLNFSLKQYKTMKYYLAVVICNK
jgi:hypothetical protein